MIKFIKKIFIKNNNKSIEIPNKILQEEEKDKEITEFNKNGKLIYFKRKNSYEEWWKYDDKNNLIFHKESSYLENDNDEWEYDEKNRVIHIKPHYESKWGTNREKNEWYKYSQTGEKISISQKEFLEIEYKKKQAKLFKKINRYKIMDIE